MTWSNSGQILTFSGAANDLADCGGDGVPTSGTNYVKEQDTVHGYWVVYNYIATASGTGSGHEWSASNQIISHVKGAIMNQFVDFAENDANQVTFGAADLADAQKPIVTAGNHYMLDQNGFVGGYGWAGSSGVFENGSAEVYGGSMGAWPVQSGSGGGTLWYWPEGDVKLIGSNFPLYGGIRFQHTTGRLQELKFGGSRRKGTSMPEVVDDISVKDVIFADNIADMSFSSFAASDERFLNISLRGPSTDRINFDSTWDNDGFLDNSDGFVVGLTNGTIGAGATLLERTSYELKTIDEQGNNEASVNARVTRTLATTAGDEPPLSYASDFLQVDIGATDASGDRPLVWLIRREYEEGAAPQDRIHYDGFFVTLRKYGFTYEYIAKYPRFGAGKGIADTIIMKANPFTVDTEVNVAAYTGISQSIGTTTITLTESHTLQEVYDWLQWENAKQANMDFEAGGNGLEQSPFLTADGNVFVLSPGWTISGESFLSLGGAIYQRANGTRVVNVSLTGMKENASFTIETDPGGVVLYSGTVLSDEAFTTEREWSSNEAVIITVRLQGYAPTETTATITNSGLNVAVNLQENPLYQFSRGRFSQSHYRFRNDNGSESAATWKAGEDIDITGQAKLTNFRLRFQVEEFTGKPQTNIPQLEYRIAGSNDPWEDVI